ncbi:cobalt-zinc-cadmium efflux system outer membrane protein [Paucibacter oligotrophus]|uniref:Cobalt-zinc-cadmium efflux system outer membrane protein n=1 Tax=Roseateles oligotrophus TaxID=1769250 RepID=A0A840L8R9_9BURK|nr:TolC family protein [Roseateles oligotrophus]MBB4844476.1 cobalt-zinc-cadmium efflux system outer membrane protein [Roseateles oligotrophus]
MFTTNLKSRWARWRPGRQALACGTLLMLAISPSHAEPQPIGLAQLFEQAWALQAEAAAAPARQQAVAARRQQAQAWTADALSLELAAKTDRFGGQNQGSREYELGLQIPLWLPGERGRSQALAEAEQGALDSRLAAARWRLAAQVREAWWQWQLQQQDLALAAERLQAATQLSRDVARRVAAGELARADQHQAESTRLAAELESQQAQLASQQARQKLLALGLQPAQRLAEQGEALPEPRPDEAVPPEHPALQELRDRLGLSERAHALLQTQDRANPALRLSSSRERGGFGEPFTQTLTLGLSIPLGAAPAQRSRLANAQAEQLEARALLQQQELQLRGEIAQARLALQSAQSQAELAAHRAALAQQTRGFFAKSFALGQSDLPQLLRVEQDAFEAQRQSQRAGLRLQQARSELRQALGLLPI